MQECVNSGMLYTVVLCDNLDKSIIESSFIGIIVIVTVFIIEIMYKSLILLSFLVIVSS